MIEIMIEIVDIVKRVNKKLIIILFKSILLIINNNKNATKFNKTRCC